MFLRFIPNPLFWWTSGRDHADHETRLFIEEHNVIDGFKNKQTANKQNKNKNKCNGAEWSNDKTQAAESIKWRPQQAYGSNQFLLVQPQTVFSTPPPKSSCSRIDKRTARATGNTRYRYSKIAPLDHKMADNCVSLARTNTLSSTITKPIKT